MDVDTIEPGVDFAEAINRAVAACTVLLAVIGPNWLTATDERGRRRLDDPDDFVRLEIEAALIRGVRVIPILADGTVMPGKQDLPESLATLTRLNALLIRHENFSADARRLVTAIEPILATAPDAAVPSSADDSPTSPGRQFIRRQEAEPAAALWPDYDNLAIASIRARLRTLDADQVRQLAEYEKAHAARPEVITMFERRIVKLNAES